MRNILKYIFNRKHRFALSVNEFAHANKDLLVIVCDPKTDELFMGYKDKVVINKIKSMTGKKANVVKDVLNYSIFKSSINGFISSLMDSLQLSLKNGNEFYKWLDGAIFNINKSLRKK